MKTKIIIADDHRVMREGLRSLLARESEFEVIADTEDGRTTVKIVAELEPNVVIMDIAMPDLNGIEATRQIADKLPGVKIIALSMHSDRRLIKEVLRAGASGYLLKDCAFTELADAIRTVMTDQLYLSSRIAGDIVIDYIKQGSTPAPSAFLSLTGREREVLQLIAEGRSTKDIASLLDISVKTADSHRQNVMKKLNIKSVANLTKYAVREGLTQLDLHGSFDA